jgi:hypothetical protein
MSGYIDAEEVEERPPFVVTRCVKHPMSYGCEAALPSCCREIVRLHIPAWTEVTFELYDETSATPAEPVLPLPNALEMEITDD